jgi:predicted phage terminase large subunit-like protein
MQALFTNHRKALLRAPRFHGKSVQTFARAVWEIGHNPNLRIKVVCGTDDLAKLRVTQMRRWVDSPLTRNVFPELKRQSGNWTNHSFTVNHSGDSIDPTVQACGWSSTVTGSRTDILILDDVTNQKNSLMSRVLRESVKDAIDNDWLNLGDETSRIWFEGNAWHFDDAFHLRCKKPKDFGFLDLKINSDLDPIWPEMWSREALEARRILIGPRAFARGFHCFPMSAEEQIFQPEWFQFWRELPPAEEMQFYAGVDPAFSDKSSADDTAIVVIGVHGRDIYVLETHAEKGMSQKRIEQKLKQYLEKYPLRRVGVESVQAQEYLYQHLKNALPTSVRRIKTTRGKRPRMILLADYFEDGRMFLRGNGAGPHKSQEQLYRHLIQFTGSDSDQDDLPDALDFAVEVMPSNKPARTQFIGRRDT